VVEPGIKEAEGQQKSILFFFHENDGNHHKDETEGLKAGLTQTIKHGMAGGRQYEGPDPGITGPVRIRGVQTPDDNKDGKKGQSRPKNSGSQGRRIKIADPGERDQKEVIKKLVVNPGIFE